MSSQPLNQILFGPPGTGKTFQAMQLAVELCDGSRENDPNLWLERFRVLRSQRRIDMVTFHQSYAYEDFVEGIRPVLHNGDSGAEDSTVRYECRKGIFRKMCEAALTPYRTDERPVVDLTSSRVWKMSIGRAASTEDAYLFKECLEKNYVLMGKGWNTDYTECDTEQAVRKKFEHAAGANNPEASAYDWRAVHYLRNTVKEGDLIIISEGNRRFRAIGRVIGPYQYLGPRKDWYSQMRPVEWLFLPGSSLPREQIIDTDFTMMTLYVPDPARLKRQALMDLLIPPDQPASIRPHVLIIDEINRGNISKILGELITLVEEDKRQGADHALTVTLPYSGEEFGVPKNLYIIGTMNTADRSIAFIDTALRRRFVFKELLPKSQVIRENVGKEGWINGVDVAGLLERLNQRIAALFDRNHQIGHSYLLKVKTLADLRTVFVDRLIPLLQEYFYDDWNRLCAVLGCPYDPDTGRAQVTNALPLIIVEPANDTILRMRETDRLEPSFRYRVNPGFEAALESALEPWFKGIIGPDAATPGQS